MNILIAADYATPGSGNFIASLFELGSRLNRRGDRIVFIFPKSPNTESLHSWVNWLKSSGHTVYLVRKDQSEETQLAELKSILQAHSIDILHLHFSMYHHIALHHRQELPVRILVHDHMDFAAEASRNQQALRNAAKSLVYRLRNIGIISVNPHKDASYCLAKHWYIPNGLSLLRYTDHSMTREECRQFLGIAPEERMCLFLGWDLHRKGLDIALKAAVQYRKEDPTLVLGIVGVGTPPKEWTVSYIRQHTDIDPYANWIRYLPSTEDMFAYHRAADVYLSASRSEAFSYGILEAISQNTPVAVSDIPGTRWCWDFTHAFPYAVEDPHACADAIRQALAAGKTPSNADEIVEKYGIDKWCREIMDVYDSII